MATGMCADVIILKADGLEYSNLKPEEKCILKTYVEGKDFFVYSTSNWILKIPLLRFAATYLDSEHLFFLFMPKSTPHKRQTFMVLVVQTVSETMQQL